MTTEDQVIQIISLRSQNLSFDKIAAKTGISKPTLLKICRQNETAIKNLKNSKREALLEEISLRYEDKLKSLGDITHKVKEELISRDLSSIPTSQLIPLYLKLMKASEWWRCR